MNTCNKTNDQINVKQSKRIYYFDVLRVIACLSVIMTHSSAPYVLKDFGSFNFWAGNFFDSVSRVGVPLFVMLSGALMLDENYEFSAKKLIGHIIKIIVFFVFWSAFYTILNNLVIPLAEHDYVDLEKIITSFLIGHYHLWFCFMIIGLYLVTPLLRLWVKTVNKKCIEYFLILSFIFCFFIPQVIWISGQYLEIFNKANQILDNFNFKYVAGFVPYFILGWYLHNFDLKHKTAVYVLGGFSLIFTVVMTFVLTYTKNTPIQAYGNFHFNILFQSIGLFVVIKSIYSNKKSNANKKTIIEFISKRSLGVYAIHLAIVDGYYKLFDGLFFDIAIVNILFIFVLSFAVSLFLSFLFSKIPILKKVV